MRYKNRGILSAEIIQRAQELIHEYCDREDPARWQQSEEEVLYQELEEPDKPCGQKK